jgi:hypothetical protein
MRLPQSSSRYPSLFLAIAFCACAVVSSLHAQQGSLTCSPAQVKFGGVVLGQSETQLVTLTNSGSSSVTISAVNLGGSVFQASGLTLPAVLSAGQSADVTVTFTPSADGWFGQNITFVGSTSTPLLRVNVQGSGVNSQALTASPASLSFGQVSTGSTVTLPLVLTNTRSWTQSLTGIQAVGSGFSVSAPGLPVKLAAGKTITVNVSFTPKVAGEVGGAVSISGVPLNIPLVGTGATTAVGQIGESPTSLGFGNVDVGSSSTQQFALSATGGPVTISSASSSNSQFTISGVSFPLTIPASQSVQVYVTYAPTKNGSASAAVSVASNASNTPSESVSGTGVTPTYSVSLSWTASTSSVAGYNIYRGTTAGQYTKLNPSLNSTTAYTDNTVAAGVTYYYAATAVNSSGEESSYSTPALQVSVP